jgi:hypothetical protein
MRAEESQKGKCWWWESENAVNGNGGIWVGMEMTCKIISQISLLATLIQKEVDGMAFSFI